jgi:hypothetical protein
MESNSINQMKAGYAVVSAACEKWAAPAWTPITGPGQVQKGDRLRFTIGDKPYSEKAKLILLPGTDKEEVVYDIGRNFYFITSMVVGGRGNHKGVEVLARTAAPAQCAAPDECAGAAADAWITAQVARHLDLAFRSGVSAGWNAGVDGDGEALQRLKNRVGTRAEYAALFPVAAPAVQARDAAIPPRHQIIKSSAVHSANHMAQCGDVLMDAVNDLAKAHIDIDEGDEGEQELAQQLEAAEHDVSESARALRGAIYEYRRRAPVTAPPPPAAQSIEQDRANFECWYAARADLAVAPIGSRDCALQWSAWLAGTSRTYTAPSDWKISPQPWGPAPAAQPDDDDREADHETIMSLSRLLAGVVLALKGPEPVGGRHSYHDLPELANKLALELELHRAKEAAAQPEQQPTAEDYSDMLRAFCCKHAAGGWNSEGLLDPDPALHKLEWIVDEASRHAAPVPAAAPEPLQGWKLASKEQPEEGDLVLICGPMPPDVVSKNSHWTTCASFRDGSFMDGLGCTRNSATHWMPIPAAPAPKGEQP